MWYPRLFRTALRLTESQDVASELTQQAFLQALERWEQFDGQALATTWLHRVLVNCVMDWRRRQGRPMAELPDEWALPPARGGNPADHAARGEQLDKLRGEIENLSPTVRAAFVMTVLDGYTYEQAADLLATPVGTIASRVHEARKQVQAAMRQWFPET